MKIEVFVTCLVNNQDKFLGYFEDFDYHLDGIKHKLTNKVYLVGSYKFSSSTKSILVNPNPVRECTIA